MGARVINRLVEDPVCAGVTNPERSSVDMRINTKFAGSLPAMEAS